jgi:glutamate N-acetyltransferase/amino-acid N-acetyltransferase
VTDFASSINGFRVAGVHAGLKKDGLLDMALVVSEAPCTAAGVFTTNRMQAAPVLVDMEKLAASQTGYRAVVVNTRCANACTGEQGVVNARAMASYTAGKLGCDPAQVLVMSTGVIGTHLPMEKIQHGIDLASAGLGSDWEAAARGIMTTDTRPKFASTQFSLGGGDVTLTGIAKGAGMIAPNMATMLGVIVTDAVLGPEAAQAMLGSAARHTFNCIVIDGDMSTNDTVLLLANGASGVSLTSPADQAAFNAALFAVSKSLAQAIVRDGEGVTKFITLNVQGASDDAAAHQIANAIATSPLVKTAFFGKDANWGRIVAAAGRSGVPIVAERTQLWITAGSDLWLTDDSLHLFENGMPTAYSEATASAIFAETDVSIVLDAGMGGDGKATVWTCDLGYDYVKINGDYRS